MPRFAYYRVSSGEVLGIRHVDDPENPYADIATTHPGAYGIITNPNLPDGILLRDQSSAIPGPIRQLGFAKHYDSGSNTIRNSTQPEIDTYGPAERAWRSEEARDRARDLLDHPQWGKLFTAVVDVIRDETTRSPGQRRALGQLKADIRSRISEND